jgi:DNA-binding HxlR family transcriptional regulator
MSQTGRRLDTFCALVALKKLDGVPEPCRGGASLALYGCAALLSDGRAASALCELSLIRLVGMSVTVRMSALSAPASKVGPHQATARRPVASRMKRAHEGVESHMNELEVIGTRCLELLSDEVILAILLCLRNGAMTATELAARGQGLSYKVVLAHLQELLSLGLVTVVPGSRVSGQHARGNLHALLPPGQDLLTVTDAAADCQNAWPPSAKVTGPPGLAALAAVADGASRAIARALAQKPLRTSDLEKLLPAISHGTLVQRLRDSAELGLLDRQRQGRAIWYGLADDARRLATIALHAALWECLHRDSERLASDLAGFVYQIAPLARLPEEISGTCVLHEDWGSALQRDIYLAAAGGQLAVHFVPHVGPSDVDAHGTPQGWARAIITGDTHEIASTGDRELLTAAISGLNGCLCG